MKKGFWSKIVARVTGYFKKKIMKALKKEMTKRGTYVSK